MKGHFTEENIEAFIASLMAGKERSSTIQRPPEPEPEKKDEDEDENQDKD